MAKPHRNLICDTIDDIAALTSVPQVGARFAGAMAKFGFGSLGINGLPPQEDGADPVILTESAPPGFRDVYVHERFYAIDHICTHARQAKEPFRYSEAPYALEQSERHRRFMQALATYRMGQGIIVPIGYATSMPACVWLAGEHPELNDDAMVAVQLISLFAASKAHALSARHQRVARPKPLTEREREVLQWVSVGKSAWEIGEILGISKRTVDEHVQTATRKLNAVNRTQAVVVALRERLISL